jgi:hypothetical protein
MTRFNNYQVIFWLHRVLSEKCSDQKRIAERISILNHQVANFGKMFSEEYQEGVVRDLEEDIKKYGWPNPGFESDQVMAK